MLGIFPVLFRHHSAYYMRQQSASPYETSRNMVNFHDPKVIQRDARKFILFLELQCTDELEVAVNNFSHVLIGIFLYVTECPPGLPNQPSLSRWEYITNVTFEWNYIASKKKIKWPLLVRLLAVLIMRCVAVVM
jgi:hypothetical protein